MINPKYNKIPFFENFDYYMEWSRDTISLGFNCNCPLDAIEWMIITFDLQE